MHLRRPLPVSRLALLATLAVAAACDNTTEPTTPASIAVTTGPAASVRAGDVVPITVRVNNANGNPLSGQTVAFSVATGNGSVTPVTATSDASGQATTQWRIGNTIGAQSLVVTSGSATSTISAIATAGRAATITFTAGSGQTAQAGTLVSTQPAVVVRDAGGNPVSGVTVNFSSSPSGVVAPATATTDASGTARVGTWTLGPTAGTYTLQAAVVAEGVSGVQASITAAATAAPATQVVVTAGNGTSGTAGTAITGNNLPSVTVRDAFGNPVAGVTVTFSVASGGGSVTGATQTTNAQGIATVGGLTLGQTAGTNVVTANAQGVGTASFVITGTPGNAARTEIVSGNNQSVRAGQPLQVGPSVRVVDQFGNPIAGTTVNFVVTGGGGAILGATQTTNAQGVATVGGWTLGATPGNNTLAARVLGLQDVVFTAVGLAGAPAQLLKVSGDSTTVGAFRTASQPFVVRVLDAEGFAVRGATVNFSLNTTGAGSLTATSVQTDEQGRASTSFVANGITGQNIVTASIGSLTPIQFVITTTSNAVASITPIGPLNQTATVGSQVPVNPGVQVRDDVGNPAPGITVFFRASNGGSVVNSTAVTDVNGIATSGGWVLSPTPGANQLAAVTSVPSSVPNSTLIFTATGFEIPAGSTLTLLAGITPATAPAGSAVQVAVQAKGPTGTPIAGATVQFQVTAGGGAIGGQVLYTTTTDASGVARVPAWTLGSQAATANSLTAILVNGNALLPVSVTTQ